MLISSDILTEKFCCDLSACKGECCVEGDAGAPVTLDEISEIENCLDEVWCDLSASAQSVIDKQRNLVLESVHPSPLSANRGGWFGQHQFSRCNAYLQENGQTPIAW